jgi:hypothetical protein
MIFSRNPNKPFQNIVKFSILFFFITILSDVSFKIFWATFIEGKLNLREIINNYFFTESKFIPKIIYVIIFAIVFETLLKRIKTKQ